ncbi:hypothetical protein SUGI_0257760 [Cryptomeria japonica]|nr:hypothetical protein SUGI_0257760 [Cryptomeria japonica]
MDPSGAKQFVLTWNNSVQYDTTGTWDGIIFSGIPEISEKHIYNVSVEGNSSGLYFTYTLVPNFNALARFVVTKFGQGQQFSFESTGWNMFWSVPRDACAVYGPCGPYGTCDSRNLALCSCEEGFKPSDNHAWVSQDWASSGCVRQSPLNCSTDRFIDLGVTLPDDGASSYPETTKKDCKETCLCNCSCTAFAFNPPSGPCQIWSGDLLNMRNSTPSKINSNVFIRVGASQLSMKRKTTSIVGVVLGIVGALTVALGICSFLLWQKHQQRSMDRRADSSDSFLRMSSYKELKIATRNFRSELGSGGSGSVFKGSLPDDPSKLYYPTWATTQITQGNTMNIVEEGVAEEADMEEVRRACVAALLCIQEDDEVRPSMREVVQMLEGKIEPQFPQILSSALTDNHGEQSDTHTYSTGDVTR